MIQQDTFTGVELEQKDKNKDKSVEEKYPKEVKNLATGSVEEVKKKERRGGVTGGREPVDGIRKTRRRGVKVNQCTQSSHMSFSGGFTMSGVCELPAGEDAA